MQGWREKNYLRGPKGGANAGAKVGFNGQVKDGRWLVLPLGDLTVREGSYVSGQGLAPLTFPAPAVSALINGTAGVSLRLKTRLSSFVQRGPATISTSAPCLLP